MTCGVSEIVKCADLSYMHEPMLFAVDCVPLDENELESNLLVRYSIFQYLLSCYPLKFLHILLVSDNNEANLG